MIDAQWAIPASTTAEGGRALVLTTIVGRRSVQAPLAGWIVRYEVTGAAASVGGMSTVDVPTDAAGRASVEVAPADAGGGTAVINIVLLQPGQPGTPPVEVARGGSTITWTPGRVMTPPALSGPTMSGPALTGPSLEPRPMLSPDESPGRTYGPPPTRVE